VVQQPKARCPTVIRRIRCCLLAMLRLNWSTAAAVWAWMSEPVEVEDFLTRVHSEQRSQRHRRRQLPINALCPKSTS